MNESLNIINITNYNNYFKVKKHNSYLIPNLHNNKKIKTILNYDKKETSEPTEEKYEKYFNDNYLPKRRKKKFLNMKNNNNKTFITSNQEMKTVRKETNFQIYHNRNNIKILKKIFPNIDELNLYSNIPLYPFNKENKNNRNKKNLKKEIYDYYYKNKAFKTNSNNYDLSHFTLDDKTRNKKIKKSNTYVKYIHNTNKSKSTNNKNLSVNTKNKNINLQKNRINEFFRNKEIIKYFSDKENLPNIYKKNENKFKTLKISKNKNDPYTIKNITVTDDNKNNIYQNYYNYTEYNNKIESILSRAKIKTSDEIRDNNYKIYRYVDKGINTDYESSKI